jgi:ribosome-binding factor A
MSRAERLGLQIQRELAELVREVKDPRVQEATLLTVTKVHLSDDLGVARVLVSVIGEDAEGVVKGLARAKGFLQGQLGKRLRTKKAPELRFALDTTEERAGRIDAILREIHGNGDGDGNGDGTGTERADAEPEEDREAPVDDEGDGFEAAPDDFDDE